ncbi:protein-glutamate O-methyltransferase CheR [Alkalihalobacillus sp. MEB130]|uniref:CheR family methyltransferase n=1 Tax=Alkalihalobacillus sp. MEB130 TaxID=2976704 RepID=UPI0028DE62AD|nr:protein-glutamate O-methyltransferase CheR [Alkalihalobacillus sp. MEB130]MDT8859217.1 protein-glutamate O-methyltransferase CheR [Alkalihalobacillus sp. MEB130]
MIYLSEGHTQVERENEIERIEIELFLEGIYQVYGYDFRNYAYSSIKRRIWYRAQIENVKTISEFQSKVLYQPELMRQLLRDFSINVTEMFRDPSFFKTFRNEVVPVLRELPFIRIWHAGCSSGEEVYSMAILLYEEGLYEKTKIYATDMDEEILDKAKAGKVSLERMQLYTRNYQQAGGRKEFSEYYNVEDQHVVLHSFLKKNIVFAHHNLVTDHSFNEFHMILCRNVLIYFNQTLTNRVYDLFYNSLTKEGYLGLGAKESLNMYHSVELYEEVNSSEKIYKKVKVK